MEESAPFDLEALRLHIQAQLERIAAENDLRSRLLQEELDRRFAAMQLQLDQRFDAAAEKVTLALSAADLATTKAETAAEKRFDAVNEFRQTLSDQNRNFVTTDKYEGLERQVDLMQSRLDTMTGSTAGVQFSRTEQRLNVGAVVAVVSAVIGAAAIIVTIILATGH
jgi:chemotaxis regulatin CheY-phosphate phosphatase CheZ